MTRLLVVTLLLAAIAVVLKMKMRGTTTARAIKVTSRVNINRGALVAVVEIDGRRLLVGAAANQVNLLVELADAPPVDPLLTGEGAPVPGALARLSAAARPAAARPAAGRPTAGRVATAGPAANGGSVVERLRRMTTRVVADPGLDGLDTAQGGRA